MEYFIAILKVFVVDTNNRRVLLRRSLLAQLKRRGLNQIGDACVCVYVCVCVLNICGTRVKRFYTCEALLERKKGNFI